MRHGPNPTFQLKGWDVYDESNKHGAQFQIFNGPTNYGLTVYEFHDEVYLAPDNQDEVIGPLTTAKLDHELAVRGAPTWTEIVAAAQGQ